MVKSSRLGFTLVEILLCVVLILILATGAIVNFQPPDNFKEEKLKIETILKFTKAQAANTGKKFRVTSLTNSIKVEFEEDGLQKPGEFQFFDLGIDTETDLTLDFEPIIFYCDGWNDSSIIKMTFGDSETVLNINEFGAFEEAETTNIVEEIENE